MPILHSDFHVPGGLDKDDKLCSPGALMLDEARQASCSLRPLLTASWSRLTLTRSWKSVWGSWSLKCQVEDGRWWMWVGSQVPRSMGQRRPVFWGCLVTWPLRSCRGTDGVSMPPVFSTTYALEVLCGKQVSGSCSIYLSVQAADSSCLGG